MEEKEEEVVEKRWEHWIRAGKEVEARERREGEKGNSDGEGKAGK